MAENGTNNMMNYYRIHEPRYSNNFDAVSKNCFAYTSEMSGYSDLIKKGHPKPPDPKTILVELYTVNVPPVLWDEGWTCAFFVKDELLREFIKAGITGFNTIPVEIGKVASKGRRKSGKKEYSGEPEDLIYDRKNILKEIYELPTIWGLNITGEIILEPKDKSSHERVQPFIVAFESTSDLSYPVVKNTRHRAPILGSERFKSLIIGNKVENIVIEPFTEIWLDTKEFH